MAGYIKRPKFKGDLNKPIVQPFTPLSIFGDSRKLSDWASAKREHRASYADLAAEQARKLLLLVDHFKIDQTDPHKWARLSLLLASYVVPGLRVVSRSRGAPQTWGAELGRVLVETVNAISKERGRGIMDAIRTMRKRYPGKWEKFSASTLESRYHEQKKIRGLSRAIMPREKTTKN